MCIYYGHDSSLHYKNQEHVIPAGLGWSIKLAKEIVSDKANTFFHRLKGCIREITYLDTTYYTRTWKERQSFF